MSESYTTVAQFTSSEEALAAKGRLEAAGIPVSTELDTMAGWSLHDPRTFPVVRVLVPDEQHEAACQVLAAAVGPVAPPMSAAPEPSWPCPKCATDVEPFLDVCWACGTTRDGVEDPHFQIDTAPMVDSPPGQAEDAGPVDLRRQRIEAIRFSPDSQQQFGFPGGSDLDGVLVRAWRTSVLGIFCLPPLLTLYSMWLVLKYLVLFDGIVRRGQWRLYLSLAINLAVLLVAGYMLHLQLAQTPLGIGDGRLPPAACRPE